jgi:transaldolase
MTRFYVDTADRDEAEPLLRSGLFYGITTNPTLLDSSGVKVSELDDFYAWAVDCGAQEVFFQTWGSSTEDLLQQGRKLRAIGERVVVKAPATRDGTIAAARLTADGCPTLLTAVYGAPQALLAAAAGARYLAPYLGRMDDAGRDGLAETIAMAHALRGAQACTQVLAASVRAPMDLVQLATAGIRCFTISPSLVDKLFACQLTERATTAFEEAAARTAP